MRSRHHLAALAGLLTATGASWAALLSISLDFPQLVFPDAGTLQYDAGMDLLALDNVPIAVRFTPGGPPRFVVATGDPPEEVLRIRAVVDENGMLLGGVPEEDLLLVGEVDADGDGTVDYAGVLLTGEVAEFGFLDSGGPTDQYDFRFTVTGGALADDYFLDRDIGVVLTSESSTFAGSFAVSFSGGGKGVLGAIPLRGDLAGCTPGYWKQPHHFDSWPLAYHPDELFEDVFGRDLPGAPTLAEALRLKKGGLNALMRHATAALLNSASPGIDPDPLFDTPADVILAFQAAFDSGDYETVKNLLDDANNLGCPLN